PHRQCVWGPQPRLLLRGHGSLLTHFSLLAKRPNPLNIAGGAANMIASATIEGFKSFGSPGTPVLLGPLNFIVGANGCGKTNFVSALQFIRLSLLHGLDHTVNNEFSGCREVRNRVLR